MSVLCVWVCVNRPLDLAQDKLVPGLRVCIPQTVVQQQQAAGSPFKWVDSVLLSSHADATGMHTPPAHARVDCKCFGLASPGVARLKQAPFTSFTTSWQACSAQQHTTQELCLCQPILQASRNFLCVYLGVCNSQGRKAQIKSLY